MTIHGFSIRGHLVEFECNFSQFLFGVHRWSDYLGFLFGPFELGTNGLERKQLHWIWLHLFSIRRYCVTVESDYMILFGVQCWSIPYRQYFAFHIGPFELTVERRSVGSAP